MILYMQRAPNGLRAMDEHGFQALSKIPEGVWLRVEVRQSRNLGMHRLFWGLCQEVANNLDGSNAEQVAAAIKIATGHCEYVKTKHGLVGLPKSIAFHNMDQTDFKEFFDQALDYICSEVIPGLGKAALKARVEEMIG